MLEIKFENVKKNTYLVLKRMYPHLKKIKIKNVNLK